MNEPKQGHQQQQQQASTDTSKVTQSPPTGINPDMPADPDEAAGRPRGKRWGNENCR